MTEPQNSLTALEDVDQRRAYPLRDVARALGISLGSLRGWADRGEIRTVQARAGGIRRVPLSEVQRLQREGWPVSIEALLDAD